MNESDVFATKLFVGKTVFIAGSTSGINLSIARCSLLGGNGFSEAWA